MEFISFAGGDNEAVLSILGGNIDFGIVDPSQAIDNARAGKIRAFLHCSNRYTAFKNVPTVEEAGMGEPMVAYAES